MGPRMGRARWQSAACTIIVLNLQLGCLCRKTKRQNQIRPACGGASRGARYCAKRGNRPISMRMKRRQACDQSARLRTTVLQADYRALAAPMAFLRENDN